MGGWYRGKKKNGGLGKEEIALGFAAGRWSGFNDRLGGPRREWEVE